MPEPRDNYRDLELSLDHALKLTRLNKIQIRLLLAAVAFRTQLSMQRVWLEISPGIHIVGSMVNDDRTKKITRIIKSAISFIFFFWSVL